MLERWFASREKRSPVFHPRLEQLESRELLDAAAVTSLNTLAFYTYLTEQQTAQAITATQASLSAFQHGETTPEVIQGLSNGLQVLSQLTSIYLQESALFINTLHAAATQRLTAQEQAQVFLDEEIVLGGQGIAFGALETIAQVSTLVPHNTAFP